MTAKRIGSMQWHGYSTDDKPDAPEGATYHSVDTGEIWVMHDGMWTLQLASMLTRAHIQAM